MIMRDYELRLLNLTTNEHLVKHFKTYEEMQEFILDQKEKHPICQIHKGDPFGKPTYWYFFFREE